MKVLFHIPKSFIWLLCLSLWCAAILIATRGRLSHDAGELIIYSESGEWQRISVYRMGWTRDRVYWVREGTDITPDGEWLAELSEMGETALPVPPENGWESVSQWKAQFGSNDGLPSPPVPCFGPRPVIRDVLGFASYTTHIGQAVTAPTWFMVSSSVGLTLPWVAWRRRRGRSARRLRQGKCVTCGYDLRMSAAFGRCPECGRAM